MTMTYHLRPAQVADADEIARVHLASWQTAYRGIFPDSFLDSWRERYPQRVERWQQSLRTPDPPGTQAVVAETASGEMVGFSIGGSERSGRTDYRGELHAIYLLAEHRGQGLGRWLFEACVAQVASLGHQTLMVWVLERNPWRAFYQAMGGRVIPGIEKPAVIADTPVREIVYGWDQLPVPTRDH